MRMLGGALWSFLLMLMLVSCGGGGGGADSPASVLAFTPSVITANFKEGTSATLNVRATVVDRTAINGPVYIYVVDSQQVLSTVVSITQLDTTNFSATLRTLPTLPVGRYQGVFQIQLCKNVSCTAEYAGSRLPLPYDLTVTPSPLLATPNSTTSRTVHWGGSIPNGLSVTVVGSGLDWTASTTSSWLRVVGGAGKGSGSFSVNFAPQTMAVGAYADRVTVRSSDGQSAIVSFALDVQPTQFVLNSGVPTFSAINGTVIAASTVSFALDNSVASSWTASSKAPWLGLIPVGGTTPANIALQPDPSIGPLGSGLHTADLILSSLGVPNKTITTSLTLVKPSWAATAASITLGGPKGRDFVTTQSLQLSLNTGINKWPQV